MIWIWLRLLLWGLSFKYLGYGETFVQKTEVVAITVLWKEDATSVDGNECDTKVKKDITGFIYIAEKWKETASFDGPYTLTEDSGNMSISTAK